MAREPNPIPITLIAFYASALTRPVIRSHDASGGVVVCWYAFLICVRCRANMSAFLGVLRVGLDAWVVGNKKGPNVVSVRACGDAWCGLMWAIVKECKSD